MLHHQADVSILSISLAFQNPFIICFEGKAMAFQICFYICLPYIERFPCTILTLI